MISYSAGVSITELSTESVIVASPSLLIVISRQSVPTNVYPSAQTVSETVVSASYSYNVSTSAKVSTSEAS